MTLKQKYILLLVILFLIPSAKSAETLFLYKGSLNRKIKIRKTGTRFNSKELRTTL